MVSSTTKNSFTKESHPWNIHIPTGADKLLIGTFPSEEKNRKYPFFYCSATNRFWPVMSKITGNALDCSTEDAAIQSRHQILQNLKLGLTDMGKLVLRQCGCSNDHSLFPLEFMGIIELLTTHTAIGKLILSGNSKGNSSLSWFAIYCSLNGVKINLKELQLTQTTCIHIAGRLIRIIQGYSTSGSAYKSIEYLADRFRIILQS